MPSRQAVQGVAHPMELMLDATDQGIYVLDAEGRCTLFNRAASAMTGWRPEKGLGRSIHELIHHTQPGGSPHPLAECSALGVLRTGKGGAVTLEPRNPMFSPIEVGEDEDFRITGKVVGVVRNGGHG